MDEKHLHYFKALEAFREKECPICFLVKKANLGYFDSLLSERVSEISFHENFVRDNGFCNLHSYQFLSYNQGLGVTRAHHYLLKSWLSELTNKKLKFFKPSGKVKCGACEFIREMENNYFALIKEYWKNKEFKTAILSSSGFCAIHYKKLLKFAGKIPDWLQKFQIQKYQELLAELKLYLDFCNFSLDQKRPALTREQELVWKKAVQMMAGQEGTLFN